MKAGTRYAGVLGLVLCLFILGCSGGDSPTDPSPKNDAIVLESITPSVSETLVAGSRVVFHARVRYTLASADTGHVALVIEDQNLQVISPSTQQRAQVTRGEGVVELADTITIPASGVTSVQVFTPLFPTGASRSTAVQQVTYLVRRP